MVGRRICLTGDILRPGPNGRPSQWINVVWLEKLLGPVLKQAAKLPVEPVLWLHGTSEFEARMVFDYYGLPVSPHGWAALFDAEPDEKIVEYICSFFEDSLVIGFEISPFLMRCLDRRGIRFIDVTIHPVRYMADIPLYFSTNCPQIRAALNPYALPEEAVFAEASMLAGVRRRMGFRPPREHSAALFCMQTSQDRVLIEGGRFISLAQYLPELAALRGRFDRLLVKPHPLEEVPFDLGLFYDSVPGIEMVDTNFYQMIAADMVDEVVSLSSGTSIEAHYFGLPSGHLFRNYYSHVASSGLIRDGFVQIYGAYLDADFWRDALAPFTATTPRSGYRAPFLPDRIRRSLNADWGLSKAWGS